MPGETILKSENLLAAEAPHGLSRGSLQCSPDPSWWGGASCPLQKLSLGPVGFELSISAHCPHFLVPSGAYVNSYICSGAYTSVVDAIWLVVRFIVSTARQRPSTMAYS